MGKATDRISLKTIAFRFPTGSPEQVYLHGKWQKERGRNPSMNYGNHPTPRQGFTAVERMLGKYFDEIRRQNESRHHGFWNERMVKAVIDRLPVAELPSVYQYRPL